MSSVITSGMELKPCPFCGGTAHIEVDDIQEPEMFWHYSPRCDDWGCLGHMFWFMYDTEEDAIEAWNTRQSHACYADEVTHRNCKYSVHRGWCEHGCKPIGEWRKTSQTQEVRERTCGCCGEEFGMDRRNGFPIPLEYLCELPNYCPNCGTKVAKE